MSLHYPMVAWAKGASIYEVNIRQYTPSGTFKELSAHLPRLADMQATILWLMPITPIAEKERLGSLGSYYACSSYTEINPEYGNKEDFREFVQQAHRLGLRVIIDWVANHTGYGHEWTKNPAWYWQDELGNFIEKNGWKDVIDLNYNNEEMQQAMIAAMQYWVKDFDIDGFRCDMAHLVPLEFWHKARRACEEIKPLLWLGECDDAAYSEVFDTTYAWKWMHDSKDFVEGTIAKEHFIQTVKDYQQLLPAAFKSYFTSNHDENSWNGTEYEKYGITALAMGAYALLLTGIPIIYSGQELPNKRRLKFFDKDEILWEENELPKLHHYYKNLLSIRKNIYFDEDALVQILPFDKKGIYINRRKNNSNLIALFNFSDTEQAEIIIKDTNLPGRYVNINSGIGYTFKNEETFILQPGDYLVYAMQ